jgi:NAD(P)-dependent dehydrogenase (short-subunit alcohol dehydrogenase family)
LTIAALNRGDKVIATARKRSLSQLEDLKSRGAETLELDVTAPIEELKTIATKAVGIYGRVDVIVNNAGAVFRHPSTHFPPERIKQDTFL